MSLRSISIMLLVVVWLTGCECASADVIEPDMDGSSSTSGDSSSGSEVSTSGTTGAPFDASRWIGRYHFENTFLPFGERGDPHGPRALVNFEILPDGRATIFYDDCTFDEPVRRSYEWAPAEEGRIALRPGLGEPWLRFLGPDPVGSIRVMLVEPCRELVFDIDGWSPGFTIIRPGESCWVDRCSAPNIMQVDYCEGEEPPPCG
jgi:hypothetical protein